MQSAKDFYYFLGMKLTIDIFFSELNCKAGWLRPTTSPIKLVELVEGVAGRAVQCNAKWVMENRAGRNWVQAGQRGGFNYIKLHYITSRHLTSRHVTSYHICIYDNVCTLHNIT